MVTDLQLVISGDTGYDTRKNDDNDAHSWLHRVHSHLSQISKNEDKYGYGYYYNSLLSTCLMFTFTVHIFK